jgi:hypothetical protein
MIPVDRNRVNPNSPLYALPAARYPRLVRAKIRSTSTGSSPLFVLAAPDGSYVLPAARYPRLVRAKIRSTSTGSSPLFVLAAPDGSYVLPAARYPRLVRAKIRSTSTGSSPLFVLAASNIKEARECPRRTRSCLQIGPHRLPGSPGSRFRAVRDCLVPISAQFRVQRVMDSRFDTGRCA